MVTDKAREEVDNLISGNLNGKSLQEVIDGMSLDGQNVVDTAKGTIDDIAKKISDLKNKNPSIGA